MIEYLWEIFTKPQIAWSTLDELVLAGFAFGSLLIVAFIVAVVRWIVKKVRRLRKKKTKTKQTDEQDFMR